MLLQVSRTGFALCRLIMSSPTEQPVRRRLAVSRLRILARDESGELTRTLSDRANMKGYACGSSRRAGEAGSFRSCRPRLRLHTGRDVPRGEGNERRLPVRYLETSPGGGGVHPERAAGD